MKKYIILLFLIIFYCCEFEPSKEYKKVVNDQIKDSANIELIQQPDTFYLGKETNFSFRISSDKKSIEKVIVYFGNDSIYSTSNDTGEFILNPSGYLNGNHILKLMVIYSSGTGSLADKLGSEFIGYKREWIVQIDKTPPSALKILNAKEENGRLVIEWEKNPHLSFQKYILYRSAYINENGTPSMIAIATIFDRNVTKYIDSSFIGNKINLYVVNYGANSHEDGELAEYSFPYPKFKEIKKIKGDSILITWTKPLFYNNVGRYKIRYKDYPLYNIPIGEITNGTDTVLACKLGIGISQTIQLVTSTDYKMKVGIPEHQTDETIAYAGDICPTFNFLIHSNSGNYVYLRTFNSIIKYNVQSGISEKSISVNQTYYNDVVMSPDGKYLINVNSGNIKECRVLNPDNLETIKNIDFSNYLETKFCIKPIAISNNGKLFFVIQNPDNYAFGTGIYDLDNNDTLCMTYNKNYYDYNYDIANYIDASYNEKFLLLRKKNVDSLYLNEKTPKALVKVTHSFLCFDPENEEYYYSYDDNNIYLSKCSDNSLIHFYNHGLNLMYQHISLDPVTHRFVIFKSGSESVYILDFKNKKIISVKSNIDLIRGFYMFYDNILYSQNGFRVEATY